MGTPQAARILPTLPPDPDYTPYMAESFRVAMGLFPLDLKDWIEPDPKMLVELAEKDRLLRERYDEVFIVQPEACEGSQEVLDLLVTMPRTGMNDTVAQCRECFWKPSLPGAKAPGSANKGG